jgi:hypothetical protein
MRRLLILIGVIVAIVAATGLVLARSERLPSDAQAVRAATARFHSVAQAEAAGYTASSPCEASPAGTMGIHYANNALVRDPAVDPTRPEVLLYLPDKDGSLKLIGVEYLVVDADQDLTTDGDRPSVLGHAFHGPMLGHAPGMPIHYDLHVWVHESNPAGLFEDWNPAISCP